MLDLPPIESATDDQPESLAAVLTALLRHRGSPAAYADVAIALGLPFVLCADREEPDVARFAHLSRDFALQPAAEGFGLRLRPLHSRATTATLRPSPEFALHFRDSYVPLIRRALAHDQPVLAWQGWPAPADDAWGVITGWNDRAAELVGVVAGSANPSRLVGPALQCYVVEAVDPRMPTPAELLTAAAGGLARLEEECAEQGDRVTGAFAWRLWAARLVAAAAAHADMAAHLRLLRNLLANRVSVKRWLAAHRDQLPASAADALANQLADACTQLNRLAEAIGSNPASIGEVVAAASETDLQCHVALQRLAHAL